MIARMARQVLGRAAGAVDRAVTLAVQTRGLRERRPPPDEASRAEQLRRFGELYPTGVRDDFFLPVRAISPLARRVEKDIAGVPAFDLSWPSEYSPFLESLRERYSRTAENQAAAVRFVGRRERKRPVAVLIHGYMAGRYHVEARLWPVRRFVRGGYDVAFFTLPFHALRADATRRGAPRFPGRDPRFSIEGFRQATADLQNFVAWLKSEGHPAVGVLGMSLGGYTAALLATVEPGLSFCVPVIPLASLADFAREQGALSPNPAAEAEEHALLERLYRVVSPLERRPLVAGRRALVVAAKADRITPVSHARKLAVHLHAPLVSFPGGHVLQFGRGKAFERVEALLGDALREP